MSRPAGSSASAESPEAAPLLQCHGLTKRFPGVLALDGVRWTVRGGEIHALCGENGAGKSTLIKVLSGVWPHGSYEGMVTLDNDEVRFTGIAEAEAAGIAVIHQELALVPEMTVAENLYLGNELLKHSGRRRARVWGWVDWHRAYADAQDLFDTYGLDLDPTARVADLGVGQQQLVEICKALAKEARLLLLDEPTAALSDAETELLLDILRQLRRHGVTCVYISHRLEEVLAISDRVTVLRDGQSIQTLDTATTTAQEIIRLMVGRHIDTLFPRQPSAMGSVVLEVQGLTVCPNGSTRPILQDIDFQVHAGEILGIGGLMGSGRTELLMHLLGAYGKRLSGRVLLADEVLESALPGQAIAKGLYLVSEDRKRYGAVLQQSIRFNLSLSALEGLLRRWAPWLSDWLHLIDDGAEVDACRDLFEELEVKAPHLETQTLHLSGGNQQKVVLGKALMTRPRVVLLDEPTRGIDVGARRQIYSLMNRLTADGMAVVMVSSELAELTGMSDRLLILSAGRVGGRFEDPKTPQEELMAAALTHH